MSNYMTNNVTVVELFAGVGGFRVGLETASSRYTTVWANQWEPGRKSQHAYDCYVHHFGASPNHSNDDISVAKAQVPEHMLLVGGFPCQDYSVAATNAKGIQGKKGVLWWEINDILARQRPPFVLLENVDRLIKSPAKQRGRDFGVILRCMAELGYDVEWRVINAADYGFMQKRRRVFIFGYHKSTQHKLRVANISPFDLIQHHGFFAVPFPTSIQEATQLTALKNLGEQSLLEISDNFQFHFQNAGIMVDGEIYTIAVDPIKKSPITLKELLVQSHVDEKYYAFDTDKVAYMKGAKRELRIKPNGEPYFYTEGPVPFPDNLNSPARTILTSEGKMNRSTHYIVDPQTQKIRTLTPIECERINGFPDDWTNTGMPEAYRYFTMGNALVVPLITVMGRRLLDIVDGISI
jgi:DNA (cytosine-5)-methyltransferase 1